MSNKTYVAAQAILAKRTASMLTTRMKWNAVRLIAILALAAAPGFATTIFAVTNWNFETLPAGGLPTCVAQGCYDIGAIPGWGGTAVVRGQITPTALILAAPPAGPTIAFSNDGIISQTVAGATVGLGTVYTLTVDIGHRLDGGMGGSADLLINGTPHYATGVDLGPGLWSVFTATYTGSSADVGSSITIELRRTTRY